VRYRWDESDRDSPCQLFVVIRRESSPNPPVSMKAADAEGSDWSAVVMGLRFGCNPPLHASIQYDRGLRQACIRHLTTSSFLEERGPALRHCALLISLSEV